jgi:hypothetical protein
MLHESNHESALYERIWFSELISSMNDPICLRLYISASNNVIPNKQFFGNRK